MTHNEITYKKYEKQIIALPTIIPEPKLQVSVQINPKKYIPIENIEFKLISLSILLPVYKLLLIKLSSR